MLKFVMAIFFALSYLSCLGTGTSQSELAAYLTDSFRDDFDQVWLTVKKVEIRTSLSDTYSTVFNNQDGLLIDAKTLRDESGEKFSFLSLSLLPAGSYDAVRVTLGTTAIVMPMGDSVGRVLTVTNPIVTHEFAEPLTLPGGSLIVDFDLANFLSDSTSVTVAIKRGSATNFGQRLRHRIHAVNGIVSRLSDGAFILVSPRGRIVVRFGESTQVIDEKTGRDTLLSANDIAVKVFGTFLPSEGFLKAAKIVIRDAEDREVYVRGTHEAVDLEANTATLQRIRIPEGFAPRKSYVNFSWSENTAFRRGGVLLNETALNSYTFSEVKGVYNEQTNTIQATRISFEDSQGSDVTQKATGVKSELNLVSNSMVLLNLTLVEGFSGLVNLQVRWNDDTLFIKNGQITTKLALTTATTVRVRGIYDLQTNTLRASHIKIEASN